MFVLKTTENYEKLKRLKTCPISLYFHFNISVSIHDITTTTCPAEDDELCSYGQLMTWGDAERVLADVSVEHDDGLEAAHAPLANEDGELSGLLRASRSSRVPLEQVLVA